MSGGATGTSQSGQAAGTTGATDTSGMATGANAGTSSGGTDWAAAGHRG
jgi:hypothetical protein